jgi:hypothetical protein
MIVGNSVLMSRYEKSVLGMGTREGVGGLKYSDIAGCAGWGCFIPLLTSTLLGVVTALIGFLSVSRPVRRKAFGAERIEHQPRRTGRKVGKWGS